MLSAYLIAFFPLAALATLNGGCSGAATHLWLSDGICITTETCDAYKGAYIPNGCPGDGDDVQCCMIGLETSANSKRLLT